MDQCATADYRNDNILLSLDHRWHTQNLFVFGDFDSNNVGEPGPYGSNPEGSIHRHRSDQPQQEQHVDLRPALQDEITDNLRADIIAGFF